MLKKFGKDGYPADEKWYLKLEDLKFIDNTFYDLKIFVVDKGIPHTL